MSSSCIKSLHFRKIVHSRSQYVISFSTLFWVTFPLNFINLSVKNLAKRQIKATTGEVIQIRKIFEKVSKVVLCDEQCAIISIKSKNLMPNKFHEMILNDCQSKVTCKQGYNIGLTC